MFCKNWIPVSAVEEVIASSDQLSGRSFQKVWRGRSTNNGGFLVAILKDLGALRRVPADSHPREPGGPEIMPARREVNRPGTRTGCLSRFKSACPASQMIDANGAC